MLLNEIPNIIITSKLEFRFDQTFSTVLPRRSKGCWRELVSVGQLLRICDLEEDVPVAHIVLVLVLRQGMIA